LSNKREQRKVRENDIRVHEIKMRRKIKWSETKIKMFCRHEKVTRHVHACQIGPWDKLITFRREKGKYLKCRCMIHLSIIRKKERILYVCATSQILCSIIIFSLSVSSFNETKIIYFSLHFSLCAFGVFIWTLRIPSHWHMMKIIWLPWRAD
jgi:hypothetical protein